MTSDTDSTQQIVTRPVSTDFFRALFIPCTTAVAVYVPQVLEYEYYSYVAVLEYDRLQRPEVASNSCAVTRQRHENVYAVTHTTSANTHRDVCCRATCVDGAVTAGVPELSVHPPVHGL